MIPNNLLDYSNRQKQFEIYTDVKQYPTLVTVIRSIYNVKKLTNCYEVHGNEKGKLSIV